MKNMFYIMVMALSFLDGHAQKPFSNVDQWLESHVDDMGGRLLLMVYKDGKIVYSHAVNKMGPRHKALVKVVARKQGMQADLSDYTLTTRQPVASCSKWLSAALVMTFVDEGKLKLTDTVGSFLPVLTKNGKGAITVTDCLSHLTGIVSPDLKANLQDMKQASSMEEAIEKIAHYPVEDRPGQVFRYSNIGLQIAGAIIEKISGKNFETLFKERIAEPLEMKSTDFGKRKVALPAGGAVSSPSDYMNFLVMIQNSGVFNGKRILSEQSITQMQINRINSDVKIAYTPAEAGGLGYGFGEWVQDSAAVSSPGLFGSFPWVDNDTGYCAFLMAFYIKSDDRQEKYAELRALVNEALR